MFSDDTKWTGQEEKPDSIFKGIAAIQGDQGSLEEWTIENLLKIHKDTCKILHLQQKNPLQLHRLGTGWLESSFAEQGLEVLADSK